MKVKLGDVCDRGSSNLAQKDLENLDGIYPVYGASGYIKDINVYHQDKEYVAVVKDGAGIGRAMLLPAKSSVIGTLQYLLPRDNIKSRYLYYAVTSMKLSKYFTGATIPHIYFKDYKEETLLLPTKDRQKEIVSVLDKIDKIIVDRKRQLSEFDNLIKSRFIEMFGDLNQNDKEWIEVKLEKACSIIHRYPTFYGMEYFDKGTPVIRIGNILSDGTVDDNLENYVYVYDTVNDDFPLTVIEKDDILMAVRGDGSAAKRIGIVKSDNLIGANLSPNLLRIKAKEGTANSMFLFWYLTSDVGQKRLDAYVNKTAKKNIAAKDIKIVTTPIPPIELQNQFSQFVYQVDKLRVEVQKSLNETQLLFASLMQKYFE